MLEQYIVDNIDNAVKNGWIKAYYQPVVRSLTGELCGFESLARWVDPEYGFLSPAQFIGTLEESELIYKLDIYMIEKVCSDIHDCLTQGKDIVPVSINFSRLDFITLDMLEVVEQAVDKYDVPRDYLHIEITESMMITDGDYMGGVIEGFRKCGYEVWMDDFGSGYSSINLLKDYNVDMLKMDMSFLTSMNPKSKTIMKSVVSMAKDIGVKTLAEGVETEEEVEFLKEIGCGRLQGYFYGKPMPLEDQMENLRKKGIKTEPRKWHHFYDTAGFHVRSTDAPLEVLVDDGEKFRTLFMNDAYKLQIFDDLPSLEEADRRIYNTASPLLPKYREMAEQLKKSKKPESFYYSAKGAYFCFKAREIAECDGLHLIKGSITNVSADDNVAKQKEFDLKLRELNHLFAVILVFNLAKMTVTPVFGRFKLYSGPATMDFQESTAIMAEKTIHPHDKGRYIEFMKPATFADRIAKDRFGVIEDAFRFKREDGNYNWSIVSIMSIPGSDFNEFLYCVKPLMGESGKTLMSHGVTSNEMFKADEYSLLWYNFVWNSTVKFFWKDRDRRYKGVSKAFADYFRLPMPDDIIGKRGEEMKWHINEETYISEEEKVLNTGACVNNSAGQCIIDGVVHHTISSKLPVYSDGEIVGLMGYIVDVEEENSRMTEGEGPARTDSVTGVMNATSFIEALIDYSAQYRMQNKDYGLILLKNTKHFRILTTYGEEFANSVLQSISDKIVDTVGTEGAVARTKDSYFAILMYTDDSKELQLIADKLKESIESIILVDGRNVTLKVASAVRLRSDEGVTDENIYIGALKELDVL
ncbi:MAG: EAL domain-containing protein [Clostridiales bacterium]|nr:EAL domain-containing protein [Clostridiales bacterium]